MKALEAEIESLAQEKERKKRQKEERVSLSLRRGKERKKGWAEERDCLFLKIEEENKER